MERGSGVGEQCAVRQRQPHAAHDATSTPSCGSELDEAGSEELDEDIATTSAQLRACEERGEVGQKRRMNVGQQGEAEIGNAVPYAQNDGSGCIKRNPNRS